MTLKSIEKLRDKIRLDVNNPWSDLKGDLLQMVDKIESEIAERYMELPVDADGVPWHVGDMTENGNVVNGITFDRHGAHFTSTLNDIDPSIHTHLKQRTVEDVLCDMIHEYACSDLTTEQTAAKYADELRDLLGGDGR